MRLFTEQYVEAVLRVVETIPPGRVLAYGDVAELVGVGGPRAVGRVLSGDGGGVPWWRVVRADGTAASHLVVAARREWLAEGTPLRESGRVDMTLARWPADEIGCRPPVM